MTLTATEETQVTVAETSSQEFCTGVNPQTGEFDFVISEVSIGNDFISQISFGGQVDPMLVYALAIVDLGAPSTFGFSFSVPVVGGPYNTAVHTMSGSLTDGGNGTISFLPTGGATDIAFATVDLTNLGLDLGGAGCVGGAGSSTCPPGGGGFSESGGFGPSSPATMGVSIAFDGSGGGDTYGVTGSLEITSAAIPEPATAVVAGLSLIGLALLRRRR